MHTLGESSGGSNPASPCGRVIAGLGQSQPGGLQSAPDFQHADEPLAQARSGLRSAAGYGPSTTIITVLITTRPVITHSAPR